MKTIEEIIAMFGGVDGLYVSIANEPFMRLVIEHIGEGPYGLPAISVAHYYEIGWRSLSGPGDVLRDRKHPAWDHDAPIHVPDGQSAYLSGSLE